MKLRTKDHLSIIFALFILWVTLVTSPVFAGDKIIQSNKMNNETNVSGDDSFGLGLANQLGAAGPTGDCFGSKQWNALVFSRQDSEFNKWCAAVWYDANGKHDLAAQMRCQIPEIGNLDYGDSTCVSANTIVAPQSEVNLSDVVNYLVIRQDASLEEISAPLRDEVSELRMALQKQENDRIAAQRQSQRAYDAREAERQAIIQQTLDQLPKTDGQ